RSMLSSRRWETITENRKNRSRKTEPTMRNSASGESPGKPMCVDTVPITARKRESTIMARAAPSQVTEYSARMCAFRTENRTITIRIRATTVVTFNNRSILPSALFARRQAPAAFEFEDVHEDAQQHVHDVIKRFHSGDGGFAGLSRTKLTGDFLKPEPFALQHHQGLDLGIFEREAACENLQRPAIDADEPGRGVIDPLSQNRAKHRPEEQDAGAAHPRGFRPVALDEAGADHHLAAGSDQPVEHARNVSRIVLAVAIHANYVFVSQFVRQFVAGLYGAAQSQMIRQAEDAGPRGASSGPGAVARTVVDDEHVGLGNGFADLAHHRADHASLIQGG